LKSGHMALPILCCKREDEMVLKLIADEDASWNRILRV
jgi:hypothetical protein